MTRLYRLMSVAAGIGVMLAIVACGNNTPGTAEAPVLTPDPVNPGEADSGPSVGNPQPESRRDGQRRPDYDGYLPPRVSAF